MTYAKAVVGNKQDRIANQVPVIPKPFLIIPDELSNMDVEDNLQALIQVKNLMVIANFKSLCVVEGFVEVGIRYVAGRYLLVDFPNKCSIDKFWNCEPLMNLVKDKQKVTKHFVVQERLIQVELRGLPLLAWNNKVYKLIVEKWGDLMFVEEEDNYLIASRRVCIA